MTVRYEANPPKIVPGADLVESTSRFMDRMKVISGCCDAIHLTENVLGFRRVSPVEIGRRVRREIPEIPITASLRVRDKTEGEIQRVAADCVEGGFSGILVLMGDPPQGGGPDSGQIPSRVVRNLNRCGVGSRIDLYLSISNRPDFDRIGGKVGAGPKGFMTQVVQSVKQVEALADNLKGFRVVPILLYPSEKNEGPAGFLNLDLAPYRRDFGGFVDRIHGITGDVLITSPCDFGGVQEFLAGRRRR